MTLSEAPAPVMPALPLVPVPASVHAADGDECHRDLRERFLHAGRDAVDDRELLQLLLSPSHPTDEAATLAGTLLETFGSAARVLAARSERLGAVGGLGETAVAAIKTAEALGIRLARARLPDRIQPALDGYARSSTTAGRWRGTGGGGVPPSLPQYEEPSHAR